MKKIISIIAFCVLTVGSAAAQATLPFTQFMQEAYDNEDYFKAKINATWEADDEGRVRVNKGGSFVFKFSGKPGSLSLEAKSSEYKFILTSYNAKLRVEVSPDSTNWTTLENSRGLDGGYEGVDYSIPLNTAFVRIYNAATSNNGNILYVRQFSLSDYDFYSSTPKLSFPDTKGLNESLLPISFKGKGFASNPKITLVSGAQFSIEVNELLVNELENEEGEGAVVNVVFNPLELGTFLDTLLVTNGDKDTLRIAIEGIAPSFQAILTPTAEFIPFASTYLSPSATQMFTLNAVYLTSNAVVTAPRHFEVSADGITFAPQLSLEAEQLNTVVDTMLYIRLKTSFVGRFSGKLMIQNVESRVSSFEVAVTGSIDKVVPTVLEFPIPERELLGGESIGDLKLTGGKVVNDFDETIEGEFRWVYEADYVPAIGMTELPIYFVPTNSYGYETVDAHTNVTVLRTLQSLTWEQELEALRVGDDVAFNAEATSGLAVTYTANKPDLIRINGATAIALAPGRVKITAQQEGDERYQPTEGIAYYITILSPTDVNIASRVTTKVFCTGGMLHIEADEAFRAQLFDPMGRLVMQQDKLSESKLIAIDALTQRILIVRLCYADGSAHSIKVALP